MLDSFDVMLYSMVPASILPDFGISKTGGGPTSVRATAQRFTFNVGCAGSALAPFLVASLAQNQGSGAA